MTGISTAIHIYPNTGRTNCLDCGTSLIVFRDDANGTQYYGHCSTCNDHVNVKTQKRWDADTLTIENRGVAIYRIQLRVTG